MQADPTSTSILAMGVGSVDGLDERGSSVCDPVQPDPDGEDAPISSREWIRSLIFVSGAAVLVTGLLIWIAFTFVFQSCGTVPACG